MIPEPSHTHPTVSSQLLRSPQLILYNANIVTVNPLQPRARALAILDDRVLAVGGDDEIRHLAAAGTRQLDLEGRTVLPGFNDAHCHVASSGLLHLFCVNCDLQTIPNILAAIRKRAESTPPGEWIQGFQYDDTKTVERRFLTRADLDSAAPNHPVFIVHRGGHTAYVNSLAFQRAGITDTTPDPVGGRIEHDPLTGLLSGRVCESAQDAFTQVIPIQITPADHQAGVRLITGMMSKAGITSATDMWVTPEDLRGYQDARAAGELALRVNCMIGYPFLDTLLAAGIRSGFGDAWIRVGGLKLMCDGSISERTARLSRPYTTRPQDYGILVADEETLYPYAIKAQRAGWQIGVHANGDVAIDLVLGLYERLQHEAPLPDPRFRIEHCTVLNESLIRRIKALNAIPTPFSSYVYFRGEVMPEYGEERVRMMFALRSLFDAGIKAAPGSDYPPGPYEPMMAMQSAVTRADSTGQVWGGNQRVTLDEAIRAATLNGAHASFEEALKGSLEPGKLADLVVLGADPYQAEPLELVNIAIERTMIGGKWVYEG
jgi:predicted amidohydrolase YtcJ